VAAGERDHVPLRHPGRMDGDLDAWPALENLCRAARRAAIDLLAIDELAESEAAAAEEVVVLVGAGVLGGLGVAGSDRGFGEVEDTGAELNRTVPAALEAEHLGIVARPPHQQQDLRRAAQLEPKLPLRTREG